MSLEDWLILSVVLNLCLIGGGLGAWYGYRITRPLRELTAQIREDSARYEERARQIESRIDPRPNDRRRRMSEVTAEQLREAAESVRLTAMTEDDEALDLVLFVVGLVAEQPPVLAAIQETP